MTENIEHHEQTAVPATPPSAFSPQAVGRLLVEARERMGLSAEEVGAKLRLTPRQVAALESGHFDELPGLAFVRGFLRNYAKLVQIDAEPLLEACRPTDGAAAQQQISLHSENIMIQAGSRRNWRTYLFVLAILAVGAAAWVAYSDFANQRTAPVPVPAEAVVAPVPAEPQAPASVPAPAVQMPETLPMPGEEHAVSPAPAASAQTPAAVPPVAPAAANPAPAPAATPAAPAGQSTLVLKSALLSWVRVQDSDGKEVFSRNVPAGEDVTITGKAPLKITIGNAMGMQATFNGKPVDLTPHMRANVARLTLE
jgi:cytoskeleton protein RodZ